MNRLPLTLLVATFALAPSATHAATAIWIGPENGSWSDPANWSTGAVPGKLDTVLIDKSPQISTTVDAGAGAFANSLQIDEEDELAITGPGLSAHATQVAGILRMDGGTTFDAVATLLIEPTGQVILGAGAQTQLRATSGITSLWWNEGNLRGSGTINPHGGFYNDGNLAADVTGELLDIYAFNTLSEPILINNGVARAVAGGQLRFRYLGNVPVAIKQTASGRIEAGPQSTVTLDRMQIEGGTLASKADETGSGIIDTNGATLRNVAMEGIIHATAANIAGRITNAGKLQILQSVTISKDSAVFAGGGIVQLGDPTTTLSTSSLLAFEHGSSPNFTVLRNLDNTIRGRGRNLLTNGTLENQGVIEAGYAEDESLSPPSSRTLQFQQGTIINSGSLRSTRGNTLSILSSQIVNHDGSRAGIIESLPGGVVEIANTDVDGGILRAIASEDEATLPHGVIRLPDISTVLTNVQLQGKIGSETSGATVDGVIDIDGSFRLRNLTVRANVEFLGGEVILGENVGVLRVVNNSVGSKRSILTLSDSTLRLHTVSASSTYLDIRNRGAIVQSQNKTATLTSSVAVYNEGLIHAEAGATLNLSLIETAPDTTHAEIRVDEGAVISTSRLIGGRVVSAPGTGGSPYSGSVIVAGSGSLPTLQDVTNQGLIKFQTGYIAGTIQNEGVIELSSADVRQHGAILQLEGSGEFKLLNRTLRQDPSSLGRRILVNGPAHTIRTQGNIEYTTGTVINHGTIQADSGTLSINTAAGGTLQQQGTLRATASNTLNLSLSQSIVNNDGLFDISPTGAIAITGTQQINNRSESDILVEGTLSTNSANLVNDLDATIRGGGIIVGTGDTTINQSILTNHGLVAPGSTVGDLQIRGNFVQSATGVLEIDVTAFAAGEFDQLIIETISATSGGNAALAGTLDFNFAPELLPALGDELVVLTAKQITGTFDTIEGLPTLATGLDWQIDYLPTMVTATVIGLTPPNLAGDFNGDGFVNLADYTVWRDGLGDTFAASDYDLWKQNFGRSANDPTPEATAPATVPEPATALLALLACATLLGRRAKR